MTTPCAKCSYVSPADSKFCRQCGAPLAVENEFTSAGTRNFGRQADGAAPSVVDSFGAETLRYGQAGQPQAAQPQAGQPQAGVTPPPGHPTANLPRNPVQAATGYLPNYPANYPAQFTPTAPNYGGNAFNTSSLAWRPRFTGKQWMIVGLALFFALGLGNLSGSRRSRREAPVATNQQERLQLELGRQVESYYGAIASSTTEARDRARRAVENAVELVRDSRRDAQRAADGNLPRAYTDLPPLDLSRFEYTGAPTKTVNNIPGRELTTMQTKDDFADVVAYYQRLLGPPIVLQPEGRERRAIFQSLGQSLGQSNGQSGALNSTQSAGQSTGPSALVNPSTTTGQQPSVVVMIENSRDSSRGKNGLEISVLRSPFTFPRVLGPAPQNSAQSPNGLTPAAPSSNVVVPVAPVAPVAPPPPPPPPKVAGRQ